MPINCARNDALVDSPDVTQQLLAGHGAAFVLDEITQNVELQRRKVDLLVAAKGLMGGEVHLHLADLIDVHRSFRGRHCALHDSFHARSEFLYIERLGDVVIGPQAESLEL